MSASLPRQSAGSRLFLRRRDMWRRSPRWEGGVWMSERYIDRLQSWARRTPDAPAILAPGRAPLTYQRLWTHIGEVGSALRSIGLRAGDRVAIVLPMAPRWPLAFWPSAPARPAR